MFKMKINLYYKNGPQSLLEIKFSPYITLVGPDSEFGYTLQEHMKQYYHLS